MYKKLKPTEAAKMPRKTRRSIARFELTDEWRMMQADIDKGLKPNEALQVVLNDDDKKRYNIVGRRSCARFIKKYIASKGLPYKVVSFHRAGEGDFFMVRYTPVLRKTA